MALLRKKRTLKRTKIENSAGLFQGSSFQISCDTPSKNVSFDRAEWYIRLSSQGSCLNFITAVTKLNVHYIIPSFVVYMTLVYI